MADLETVKVKKKGVETIINKADYDKDVHGDIVTERASADILEKEAGGEHSSSSGAEAAAATVVNADATPRVVAATEAVLVQATEGTTGSIAESSRETAERTRGDLNLEGFNEADLTTKTNAELVELAGKYKVDVDVKATKAALVKSLMDSNSKASK